VTSTGVLLAGGKATRLPNKVLLPQRDGRPVCFSGLDYLIRHGCDPIHIVIPPASVIVDVIAKHYKFDSLNFIHQPDATGVGDALNLIPEPIDGHAMIVMGDNIYPVTEVVDAAWPFVVVRRVPAWRLPHLVRVTKDGKLTRTAPGALALSTPWAIPIDGQYSSEGWPDLTDQTKVELPGEEWHDIGTVETYTHYWRHV
jgi:hypothetical protein